MDAGQREGIRGRLEHVRKLWASRGVRDPREELNPGLCVQLRLALPVRTLGFARTLRRQPGERRRPGWASGQCRRQRRRDAEDIRRRTLPVVDGDGDVTAYQPSVGRTAVADRSPGGAQESMTPRRQAHRGGSEWRRRRMGGGGEG